MIYFAGCMTHLTPAIKKSMTQLFDHANVNYWFMDEDKAPCCGRPLMQAGQYDAAEKLIINNQKKILDSGAKTLVVSCPICYKVFNEDYALPGIEVKHHSTYLLELVNSGKIEVSPLNESVVYHDPCELGRGSGIYDEPRQLLKHTNQLIKTKKEKQKSFCCGGSLANIKIQNGERYIIRDKAIENYLSYHPDILATACPLCKKTFAMNDKMKVQDISELIWRAVQKNQYEKKQLDEQLSDALKLSTLIEVEEMSING